MLLYKEIILALIPIPLFYLIYIRYFAFKPEYVKHLESFLYGVALALIIKLSTPFIFSVFPFSGAVVEAFFKAALIEKIGAFGFIYLVQRYYPNFSIMESVVSAMLLGLGFSLVENLFFAVNYGSSVMLVRLFMSVPLHLTTCGFIGYFMANKRLSETPIYHKFYIAKALVIPILFHGFFDMMILSGGALTYVAGPFLTIQVFLLELMIARSSTIFPLNVMELLNLRFEDWLTIDRQPHYERWILNSMGTSNSKRPSLLQWKRGSVRWTIMFFFMGVAVIFVLFQNEVINYLGLILKKEEQISLLGILPAFISLVLFLVGAINPKFFQDSVIRIPIICDVVNIPDIDSKDQNNETYVTFDITAANCFLRTAEPLYLGTMMNLVFQFSSFTSPVVNGEVIWENFTNNQGPKGSLIRIADIPPNFLSFLVRYDIFRFAKGLLFNSRFPGFESIRKFFMRPITIMQNEKFLKANKIIYNEGEKGHDFYLVKKGKVLFYKKKESGDIIVMGSAEVGEIFGEMSLLGDHARSETAVCGSDCVIAVANRCNLDALINYNSDFVRTLITTLAGRIDISEKILSENIKNLEKHKKDSERLFHVTLLFILVGLGYNPDPNNINLKLDRKKISNIIRNMDDEIASEIISLVIKKQSRLFEGMHDISDEIFKELERISSRFDIDIL